MTRIDVTKRAEEYAKEKYTPRIAEFASGIWVNGAIEISNAQLDEALRNIDYRISVYVLHDGEDAATRIAELQDVKEVLSSLKLT